jgi:cell division initiation protein
MRKPILVLQLAGSEGGPYLSPRSEGGKPMSDRITAMDVESQQFPTKMRGYDPGEVRSFLKSVAEEIERQALDNGNLREEIGRLRAEQEAMRSREQTLQQTLVAAQKMSEEMKEKAKAEADLLVREARVRAEQLTRQAHDELLRIEASIQHARMERDTLERRLRGVLEQHAALLDLRAEAHGEMDNLRVMPVRAGQEAG